MAANDELAKEFAMAEAESERIAAEDNALFGCVARVSPALPQCRRRCPCVAGVG